MRKIPIAAVAAAALLTVAACSHPAAAPADPAAATSAASPSTPTVSVSPQTPAGAKAAAVTYFSFYGASQYAATYPLLARASHAIVSERTWVAVHEGCKRESAGLSYKVTHPLVSGTTAVVTVSLAGAAASISSEQASFTYAGGRWGYDIPDPSVYRHHTARQALAALNAEGECGG
jgi:hypothetical protein